MIRPSRSAPVAFFVYLWGNSVTIPRTQSNQRPGCYWHRCPRCRKDAPLKTNEAFWRSKLASNVDRDALNEQRLRELGFSIVVVWECDVRKELEGSVRRVLDSLVTAEAFAEGESSDKMDRRFTEE